MLVEVWSDIMCPWCYLGKRRLETALSRLPGGETAEVRWRSFELRPAYGREPSRTLGELMSADRGMPAGAVPKMFAWIERLGADEGLELSLAGVRPVNSFDAHRVAHLAAARGRQPEVVDRLFRAHLSENVDVADLLVLADLAAEAGLDRAEVARVLAGDDYADDVRADERRARDLNITAVPTFVVDGGARLSGSPPVGELQALLSGG
ncbi:DSBA oxidoreductase [Actinoplanes cyaneus]|uniref:DSBA oxidoreductase n=1 Tax=Actinoplanes cyaneus TaxID=52696 RepID=A0A919ISY5_9ACTN|nr:DsbA family oxidoreductase [Actinoplanes cyaneus]MCW2139732.1 putative dithiol-disulfide isomerase, DsbA family [Actinoplanes cyaneus]GID69887.1 DSBA oxidoreductase [Actinoplanes cyaneus]